jgi:predicted O-methyltransferase YrrM|tara:strand:- start:59 stop:610 length:552 start_codon:yes stop_codon:yes gene_type:complete
MKTTEEISGWFNYPNAYKFLIDSVPDGGIFVECGSWLGKSSSFLCDHAKDRIKIFIVDTWTGSESELKTMHELALKKNIYEIFLHNMGNRKFTAIKKDSIDASRDFEDEECDVVYIDMEHTYEAVKKDIEYWLPKVKPNGIIAGHDYYDGFPGVVRAVDEKFHKSIVSIMDDITWVVHKKDIV